MLQAVEDVHRAGRASFEPDPAGALARQVRSSLRKDLRDLERRLTHRTD
ncbi:hypothetical protein ACFY1U_13055 [Streptomyces sp. NPDC001351]